MEKETLLADIAQKHKELTATNMTNASFCAPVSGSEPTFTVTWNHDIPQNVMLFIYGGKCGFSYGPNGNQNNPVVYLDSQDGQNGYIAKTIAFKAGQGMAINLLNYINTAAPGGFTAVGVSW